MRIAQTCTCSMYCTVYILYMEPMRTQGTNTVSSWAPGITRDAASLLIPFNYEFVCAVFNMGVASTRPQFSRKLSKL